MTIQNISEAVYMIMCLKIGTQQQVTYRRETLDIWEIWEKTEFTMVSGSYGEGFRLSGSDIDYMFWSNDERVIWNFSHCQLYITQDYTLIICDSSGSPPGFTLLWLPSQITSRFMRSACFRMNDY